VAPRFDTDALIATLQPIAGSRGRHALAVPVYDRARRTMYERPLHVSIGPDDLVIVEGVPALVVDSLVALAGVKVHLQMPEPQRLALLRADYRRRSESDAAVDALIASRTRDESVPVAAARARADFIVEAWTAQ